MDSSEFIVFEGVHHHAASMMRFFEWLRDIKETTSESGGMVDNPALYSSESGWLDFLDDQTMARIGAEESWSPEDIIECILRGEYRLLALELQDQGGGKLRYDPSAFPFGGTDALKAFVQLYGYSVTRDSFWDGNKERAAG